MILNDFTQLIFEELNHLAQAITPYFSDEFWGAFLPVAASLVTLWFSNSHNRKMQHKQLEHTSLQMESERKHQMRLEIYQELFAQLDSSRGAIAKLPYAVLDKDTENHMNAFFRAISKSGLVAEPETGLVIQRMSESVSSLFLWAVGASTRLNDMASEITEFENELEKSQHDYFQLAESANPDAEHVLQQLVEDQEQLLGELNNARPTLRLARRETLNELIARVERLQPEYIALLSALRADLSLKTDIPKLEERMHSTVATMRKELNQFLDQLDANT